MKIIRSKSSVEDTDQNTEKSTRSVEIQGEVGTTSFSFYFEHDGTADERTAIKNALALMIGIGGGLTEARRTAATFLEKDYGVKEACQLAVSDGFRAGFWLYNLKSRMGGISDGRVKLLVEMMVTLGVVEEVSAGQYKAAKNPSQVDLLFLQNCPTQAQADEPYNCYSKLFIYK